MQLEHCSLHPRRDRYNMVSRSLRWLKRITHLKESATSRNHSATRSSVDPKEPRFPISQSALHGAPCVQCVGNGRRRISSAWSSRDDRKPMRRIKSAGLLSWKTVPESGLARATTCVRGFWRGRLSATEGYVQLWPLELTRACPVCGASSIHPNSTSHRPSRCGAARWRGRRIPTTGASSESARRWCSALLINGSMFRSSATQSKGTSGQG